MEYVDIFTAYYIPNVLKTLVLGLACCFIQLRLMIAVYTILYSMVGSRHILPAQGIVVDSTEYMYKQLV
jgi:hypothetical protein